MSGEDDQVRCRLTSLREVGERRTPGREVRRVDHGFAKGHGWVRVIIDSAEHIFPNSEEGN